MKVEFKTIHEALSWASLFLRSHDREEKVAEILLIHHTGMEKSKLLASLRETLEEKQKELFIKDVKNHADTGIPVQHLTGEETFYGRRFLVNPNVLIPRQETEELVYNVLKEVKKRPFKRNLKLVDLGTGSGIIAVSLKLECPELEVSAADISIEALKTAARNAERLEADIELCQGDFLQPFIEANDRFDVIVSNPPYIAEFERNSLSQTVKDFDPSLALFAKEEGLAAYRTILNQARQAANPGALLAFEIGWKQGEAVEELVKHVFPYASVEIKKDINGQDRMAFVRLLSEK